MSSEKARHLLLLINDLMFVSGLRSQAESAGWRVSTARNQEKLEGLLATGLLECDLLLLDLDARSNFNLDRMPAVLNLLLEQKHIAFYSHMDQDAYQAGKQLGFSEIVPRSKLSDKVSSILSQ